MAQANLRIVIDALNKASDDINKIKGEIQGVDKSSKNAAGSVGKFDSGLNGLMTKAGLVTAAVGAVALAVKQVYDMASEGAQLEYAAGKFDDLATAAGTSADVLMVDLRAAVKGTRSDMELMTSAGDFMALGLAKSHDEIVRLTRVAGALNMDMNQLVLTLTNKTTMRFDALGVSVDGFEERVRALEAAGYDANAAFTEAFLQQAEQQIMRVGDAADTDVGKIARMEAATKNLGDAFKLWLAPGVANAAEAIAGVLTAGQTLEDQFVSLNNQYRTGKITADEYRKSIEKIAEANGWNISSTGDLTETVSGYGQTAEKVVLANVALSESEIGIIEKYRDAEPVVADMNERLREQYEATDSVVISTLDAQMAMTKYSDALVFKMAAEGLSGEAALELAYSMGLVDEATVLANNKIALWKQQLDDNIISQATYNALIAGMKDRIDELQDKVVTVTLNTYENTYVNTYTGSGAGGGTVRMQAGGGPVSSGNLYGWQEYGYGGEIFVPSQSGYVLSRSEAADIIGRAINAGRNTAGGGNINITVYGAGDPRETANQIKLNLAAAKSMIGAA